MHRSDTEDLLPARPVSEAEHALPRLGSTCDWRGWIVLAWALWFGLLYGKMVVESRGHRVRALVHAPHVRSAQ